MFQYLLVAIDRAELRVKDPHSGARLDFAVTLPARSKCLRLIGSAEAA